MKTSGLGAMFSLDASEVSKSKTSLLQVDRGYNGSRSQVRVSVYQAAGSSVGAVCVLYACCICRMRYEDAILRYGCSVAWLGRAETQYPTILDKGFLMCCCIPVSMYWLLAACQVGQTDEENEAGRRPQGGMARNR